MRRFLSTALTLAVLSAPLAAQSAHPSFAGTWTLDPKSVEGPMAPSAATMTITQDAKTLKLDQSVSSMMGDQKAIFVYNLDGTPNKNSLSVQGMSLDMNSTAAWDGNALVVKTSADIQGQALTQSERWTLEPDGKTLQIQREASVAGQSMSMTLKFTKS